MTSQIRVKNVVVAIVHDDEKRFLLCFNRRWKQYAFPMKGTDPGDDRGEVAVQALNDHCPLPLTDVVAEPMEYLGVFGPSWGTGQDTFYNYHVHDVKVASLDQWPEGHLGSWCGFLDYDRLMDSPLVSWSTKGIARELMEGQKVALGVICRPPQGASGQAGEREFLLIEKPSYGGFFFPVARVKEEVDPVEVAIEAVQSDTRYLGRITPAMKRDVESQHYSPRYDRQRTYRFYLCRIDLPDADLLASDNRFVQTLNDNGITWGWFTETQLRDPEANGLSPTIGEVRNDVLAVCSA